MKSRIEHDGCIGCKYDERSLDFCESIFCKGAIAPLQKNIRPQLINTNPSAGVLKTAETVRNFPPVQNVICTQEKAGWTCCLGMQSWKCPSTVKMGH